MKNLQNRDGVWYFRARVDGKVIYRSLKTGDKKLAMPRARQLLIEAEAKHWDILDAVKTKKDYATLDEVLKLYKATGFTRGVREKTLLNNISSLGRIVTVGAQADMMTSSVQILDANLVRNYVRAMITSANQEQKDRQGRNVASLLRQARSVFAPWAMEQYQQANLKLPDMSGFRTAGRIKVQQKKYHLPPQRLIDDTLKAGRELKEKNPALCAVFVLCYDVALRAGEAVAAKWDWIRTTDGKHCIEIRRDTDFQPKGADRSVPISQDVFDLLQALRGASEYILPGKHMTARHNLVGREFAAWMREIGWGEYQKAAHELRKLMGSRWYTERGAEVAQKWLGHESVATTCTYYADLTKQPEPLAMKQ